MGYWPVVKRVIKDADVVLEILDARMPELSRNRELERKIKYYGKEYVLVFNKIDLISQAALNKLREKYPSEFFVSGTKNIGLKKLKVALIIRAKKAGIEKLSLGVVGYPNMGKSAVINALTHRAHAKVASMAGTTKGIQWINNPHFQILDSPGVVPFGDDEVSLGLLGAKNPEKMKNMFRVAFELIKNLVELNKPALEEYYGIKSSSDDAYEIFLEIGKTRGFLKKGAVVDEQRTAKTILKDWQAGRLRI